MTRRTARAMAEERLATAKRKREAVEARLAYAEAEVRAAKSALVPLLADERYAAAHPLLATLPTDETEDPDASDRQCAWADYRKDYGVGEPEMVAAHKAFMAGWKAAREGDQSGPLR